MCVAVAFVFFFFFFQAEDGIRDATVTGVQTCALPISQLHLCQCLEAARRCYRRPAPHRGASGTSPPPSPPTSSPPPASPRSRSLPLPSRSPAPPDPSPPSPAP